jgi:O-acetylhomoserine/O-acetylserine sulfhydrylase-like pyridoxal-dependent enzyme
MSCTAAMPLEVANEAIPHLGQSTGYDYTRTKNPTRSAFEESFAKLEGGIASFATLFKFDTILFFIKVK